MSTHGAYARSASVRGSSLRMPVEDLEAEVAHPDVVDVGEREADARLARRPSPSTARVSSPPRYRAGFCTRCTNEAYGCSVRGRRIGRACHVAASTLDEHGDALADADAEGRHAAPAPRGPSWPRAASRGCARRSSRWGGPARWLRRSTFTLAGSSSSPRMQAIDCAANASFSSTRSRSFTRPARPRQRLLAGRDRAPRP